MHVEVVVYRFSGWQGLFKIPHTWCPECDLLIRAVERAIAGTAPGTQVRFVVQPWFFWFWKPLLKGAWHPPILIINGTVVSQGVVPPTEAIEGALKRVERCAS
ncbi:MAG: hypothetical protein ACP5VE_03765 [Chthonomonadales bacterium]